MSESLTERIIERKDAIFSLSPPYPNRHFCVEITNICNHKCIFCANADMSRKRRIIDEKLLYSILRQAYELGSQEVGLHMNGEPFVCPDFPKYIKKAKEIGFPYVYSTTNGSLVTPERLREAVEAGLDSIKFSINAGSRETYKLIHGSDDFDIVRENLRYCKQYREESGKHFNIFVSFIVTKHTEHEVESFKQEFSELADEVAFYKVRSWGVSMPGNFDLVDRLTELPICVQPFNNVQVTCEGYLVPCCSDTECTLLLGDLNEMSLKDAWYGEKMTALRKKMLENDLDDLICRECLRGGGAEVETLEI